MIHATRKEEEEDREREREIAMIGCSPALLLVKLHLREPVPGGGLVEVLQKLLRSKLSALQVKLGSA